MSHFSVLVVLPPDAPEPGTPEFPHTLDDVLAPYDEDLDIEPYEKTVYTPDQVAEIRTKMVEDDPGTASLDTVELLKTWDGGDVVAKDDGTYAVMSTYPPDAKWDWWTIEGRFTPPVNKDGERPNVGRLHELDYIGMREAATRRALEEYKYFTEATAGLPIAPTWAEVRDKYPEDIDAARAEYHQDPWIKAASKTGPETTMYGNPHEYWFVGKGGEDAFVMHHAANAGVTYALVTPDRRWHQRGEMGWFGLSSNEDIDWPEHYHQLVAELDPQCWYVLVDCHI